jgi:hypothetical protein
MILLCNYAQCLGGGSGSALETEDDVELEEEPEDEPVVSKYYESVTVGATAAHHLGFDRGGLRSMFKLESQSQAAWHRLRDIPEGHVSIEQKVRTYNILDVY